MKRKTNEEFKVQIYNLVGNEYIFNDVYVNSRTKINCTHAVCGYNWMIKPADFINGIRCPSCNTLKKSDVEFKSEIESLVGNEYIFTETYVNNLTKLNCTHTKCNTNWKISPVNFMQGRRCPKCKNPPIPAKTNEKFLDEIINICGDEYKFLDPYINARTKIRCIHNINDCNNTWEIQPCEFIRGVRCPTCSRKQSKGEKFIQSILDSKQIIYESEYIFNDCKYDKPLRFDFFFELNSEKFCIEYDGIQHFQAIDAWGGEEGLELTQHRDSIKNEYCENNDIHLLRIPYTESFDNFESIINNFINKRSTTIPQGSKSKYSETIDPQK